jgi:hypothetical protein
MDGRSGPSPIRLWPAALVLIVGAGCAAKTPAPLGVSVLNQPNVSVVNAAGNPVPVVDAKDPSLNPFQVDRSFSLRRGEGSAEAVLGPVGNDRQRVVIEHVTVDAVMPEDQRAIAYIKIGEIKHALVLTSQGIWGPSHRYRTSQPIRLYAIGGGIGFALAGIERTSTEGSASYYFTVSGYLVDLP